MSDYDCGKYEKDLTKDEITVSEIKEKKIKSKTRGSIAKTFLGVATAGVLAAGAFSVGLSAGRGLDKQFLNTAAKTAEQGLPAGYDIAAASSLTNNDYTFTNSFINTVAAQAGTGYSEVYSAVQNSVVSINVKGTTETVNMFGFTMGPQEVAGAGSGIIFYEDDQKVYIVTNFHVVESATSAAISLDDETLITANYVGGDKQSDIAVISVSKQELIDNGIEYKTAVFGDSSAMNIADLVMAVGNALGEGKTATVGIISAKDKNVSIDGLDFSLLQTDAAINKGNSGGALVNMNGEVIGINAVKLMQTGVEGFGYAIPSNDVLEVIDNVMNNGKIEKPILGISAYTVTEEHVTEYNYPSYGVYVDSLTGRDTTAASIGLKANDIITSYNGVKIETIEQLIELIGNTKIGNDITIDVVRAVRRVTGWGGSYTIDAENMTLEGKMQSDTSHPDF